MFRKTIIRLFFVFISSAVFFGCNGCPVSVIPSDTPAVDSLVIHTPSPEASLAVVPEGNAARTPDPSRTSRPTITKTAGPSVTPPPIFNGVSDIPDGEYLLYSDDHGLSLISRNGSFEKNLFTFHEDYFASISADKRIVFLDGGRSGVVKALNLETMVQTDISFMPHCQNITLSLDHQILLGLCSSPDYMDIVRFSWDGTKEQPISHFGFYHAFCDFLAFSPDGEWISYYYDEGAAENGGFYISPSTCIDSSDGCDKAAIGPFRGNFYYAWAPDSQHLAAANEGQLRLYAFTGGNLALEKTFENVFYPGMGFQGIAWSLDSSKLTYLDPQNCVNEFEFSTGKAAALTCLNKEVHLLTWLKVSNGRIVQ